ncbi:MAG: hypothetical protein ACRC6I_06835, partial [Paracoccaceae bacterium]
MNRQNTAGLGIFLLVVLAGCAEQRTTRATPERLDQLVASGIDPEVRSRAEERLATTLGRDNATGALAGTFGEADVSEGAVGLEQLLASTVERNPEIGRAAQSINRADAERMNAI